MTTKTIDVASIRTRTADIARLSTNRIETTALNVSAPTAIMHFSNSAASFATATTSIGNGSAVVDSLNCRQPIPFDVEIAAVYAHSLVAPGAGESYTIEVFDDGVQIAAIDSVIISETSTSGSQTGLAAPITAGSDVHVSVTYSGGASVSNNIFSVSLALRPVQ